MTNLAVVSYPVLAPADRDWIEALRALVPHITIGASQDFSVCERIARIRSPLDRQVRGRLEAIELLEVSDGRATALGCFPLGG